MGAWLSVVLRWVVGEYAIEQGPNPKHQLNTCQQAAQVQDLASCDNNTSSKSVRNSNSDTAASNDEYDTLEDYLEYHLRAKYKTVVVPSSSCTDKGILSTDARRLKLQLSVNDVRIPLEEIFDVSHNQRGESITPNKILIEAPPGYGKSMLTRQLINDWALKRDYVSRFKFGFLIRARNLRRNLLDEMINIAENSKLNDKKELKSIFDIFGEKTLVILDGLDELDESNKWHVLRAFFKEQYKFTIVATSRTGSFKVTDIEKEVIAKVIIGNVIARQIYSGQAVSVNYDIFDKKIELQGLNGSSCG